MSLYSWIYEERTRDVKKNRYTVIYSEIRRSAGNPLHFPPPENGNMEPKARDVGKEIVGQTANVNAVIFSGCWGHLVETILNLNL